LVGLDSGLAFFEDVGASAAALPCKDDDGAAAAAGMDGAICGAGSGDLIAADAVGRSRFASNDDAALAASSDAALLAG